MFRIPGALTVLSSASALLGRKFLLIRILRIAGNQYRISAIAHPTNLCSSTTTTTLKQSQVVESPKDESASEISLEVAAEKILAKYGSIPVENRTPEEAVEALVELMELHRTVHSGKVILNQSKHSAESNLQIRDNFMNSVHSNPVLGEITKFVSDNLSKLSDEHLGLCIIFVKALKLNIRHEFAQGIIEDMLRRKETLSTSALRTLIIALRNEYIYGCLIVAEFLPTFYSQVLNLSKESSDDDIRNVSSALRTLSYMNCTTEEIVRQFVVKIHQITNDKTDVGVEALVRIIPVLFELQFLSIDYKKSNKAEESKGVIIVPELMRKCCRLLGPHVDQLDETHMQTLSKFLEFQQEPVDFIHALLNRANDLWMENYDRVDLMSTVRPKSHDIAANIALLKYFNKFLDNCVDLKPVVHVAYRALKKLHFDADTYDKYWTIVNQLVIDQNSKDVEESNEERFSDLEDSSVYSEAYLTKPFLTFAHEYLNVLLKQNLSYCHKEYEATTRDLIFKLLKEHKEGRVVLLPSDYAKAVAFLLAINAGGIELDSHLLKACDVEDLILINKGAEIGGSNSFILSNLLSLQSENLFRTDLTAMEYIGLTKVNASFQKHVDLNPMFRTCLENVVHSPLWNDSRVGKELLSLMLGTGYYYPQAIERVGRIIVECEGEVSLKCVEKFLWATYIFGTDYTDAVEAAANITEMYFDYIHPFRVIESALSLCYHRALSKTLIKRIFSIDFIDILDQQIQHMLLKHNMGGYRDPSRVRNVFMSLNRAVCLDVPDANIPWFHQKYCEEIVSACKTDIPVELMGFVENTDLNNEVGPIIESLVGPGKFVRNTFAPYYHHIDFLLHLDEDGRPQNMATTYGPGPTTKLAIISNTPKDFTLNARQLKGPHVLKKRHLEISGYRVINISPLKWNSMHMSEASAKKEYVKSCIFG